MPTTIKPRAVTRLDVREYRLWATGTEVAAYRAAQRAREPADRPWNWESFGREAA